MNLDLRSHTLDAGKRLMDEVLAVRKTIPHFLVGGEQDD